MIRQILFGCLKSISDSNLADYLSLLSNWNNIKIAQASKANHAYWNSAIRYKSCLYVLYCYLYVLLYFNSYFFSLLLLYPNSLMACHFWANLILTVHDKYIICTLNAVCGLFDSSSSKLRRIHLQLNPLLFCVFLIIKCSSLSNNPST